MKEVQAADQGLDEFDRTQRCSLFSQSTGDEPIGQARTPTHQVFVEAPLPWSRNFLDSQEAPADIKGVIAEARQAGVAAAALGIVPDAEYSAQGASHLFLFRRPEGLFSRFEKRHYLLPPDAIGPALRALLIEPGGLHGFDEYQQDSNDTREVFVCTHGTRDACCGTFGYPVYQRLRDTYAAPGVLRAWRTSHTGGHRFAPTLVDYPEGRFWGHMNAGNLDALVNRAGEPAEVRAHLRGWAGFGRMEQVVDREIFLREGWGWLGYAKRGFTTAEGVEYAEPTWLDDVETAEVRIEFSSPDGADRGAYIARVVHDGESPFGGCGKALGFERQFKVARLERASV